MTPPIIIAHGRLRYSKTLASFRDETQAHILYTEYQGHAIELARNAANDVDTIYVAGGDGTLNEVVNGVMQMDANERPHVKLLPLGTGNDTSRTLMVVDGTWDVIKATMGRGSDSTTRYGINISDVGLGGAVVQRYTDRLRSLPGQIGYVIAIVRSLLTNKASLVRITLDDKELNQKALMVCICNGRWFGGAVGIAPMADPTDGVLNVVVIGEVSVFTYARFLPKLKKGLIVDDPRITYYRASRVSIESQDSLPLEMDGEYIGQTPVAFEVVRKAVNISLEDRHSKTPDSTSHSTLTASSDT